MCGNFSSTAMEKEKKLVTTEEAKQKIKEMWQGREKKVKELLAQASKDKQEIKFSPSKDTEVIFYGDFGWVTTVFPNKKPYTCTFEKLIEVLNLSAISESASSEETEALENISDNESGEGILDDGSGNEKKKLKKAICEIY